MRTLEHTYSRDPVPYPGLFTKRPEPPLQAGPHALVQAAGFEILAQLEMNADCVGTLRNHIERTGAKSQVLNTCLEDLAPREARRGLRLRRGKEAIHR